MALIVILGASRSSSVSIRLTLKSDTWLPSKTGLPSRNGSQSSRAHGTAYARAARRPQAELLAQFRDFLRLRQPHRRSLSASFTESFGLFSDVLFSSPGRHFSSPRCDSSSLSGDFSFRHEEFLISAQ